MTHKTLFSLAVAALLFAAPLSADGRGKWKRHHHRHARAYAYAPLAMPVPAPVYWAPYDLNCLRSYYGPYRHRVRPARYAVYPGRRLPSDFYRWVEPIPVVVERRLAPLPYGYSRGFIGGSVVIYNRNTSVAIDVARLFQ